MVAASSVCEICGFHRNLEVHHIEPKRMGGSSRPEIEAPANKITICRTCHVEITENRWRLERSETQLIVTSVTSGEIVVRRLYSPTFDAPQYFQRLTIVGLELEALVHGIPYLNDEQLVELFADLRGLDKGAWRAQAAILWEAKQRSVYGDHSWEAMGRTFGVGWRQAYNLARVWETFFKGDNGEFCNQLQNCSLEESTWYVVSSETQAPHFWLAYAEDRKSFDPAYSIADFREEIRIAGAKAEEDSCHSSEGDRCRWRISSSHTPSPGASLRSSSCRINQTWELPSMPTKRPRSIDEVERQALARAKAERVRLVKLVGQDRYLARSRTVEPGAYYELSVSPWGHIRCSCPGFSYRSVCKHSAALKARLISTLAEAGSKSPSEDNPIFRAYEPATVWG